MRKNSKLVNVDFENSINKSNSFSLAKISVGLTLNQMQLFAFAIYSTQKNGNTEFNKKSFEEKFNLSKYQTLQASKDTKKLMSLQYTTLDLKNDNFDYINIFQRINYNKGTFTFSWSEEMIPHILNLQDHYITTDLTIASKFSSSYSWTLYEYLKASYGYWHKEFTKEELLKVFSVENIKSYIDNTGVFKKKVLEKAILEVNEFTELEVWFVEKKEGRSITGFDLNWSTGRNVVTATEKQITELTNLLNVIEDNMFEYIDLKDEDGKKDAIQTVKESIEMKKSLDKSKLTLSSASLLIQKAKFNLKKLETLLENSKQKKAPFYNWLEERE